MTTQYWISTMFKLIKNYSLKTSIFSPLDKIFLYKLYFKYNINIARKRIMQCYVQKQFTLFDRVTFIIDNKISWPQTRQTNEISSLIFQVTFSFENLEV